MGHGIAHYIRSDSGFSEGALVFLVQSDRVYFHGPIFCLDQRPEPEHGAHTDAALTAANLKTAIISSLNELRPLSRSALLESRYARFRRFGTAGSQPVLSEVIEGTP